MNSSNSSTSSNTKFSKAKKITSLLLTIIGALLFFVTFVNFSVFDEKLNPEIINSIKPMTPLPDNENAYLAIWGMGAEQGINIISAGKAIDKYYNNRLSSTFVGNMPDDEYIKIMGGINLDDGWIEQIDNCRSRTELNCTSQLSEQLTNNPVSTPRLQLMLLRYKELTKMSNFQVSAEKNMESTLPPYGNLMKLRSIHLAKIFQEAEFSDFTQKLKQDMKFWRMLLEDGDTLIDKMIAIASIWANVQAISEYSSNHTNISFENLLELNQLLQPLTSDQRNIGNSFLFEQKAFINTLKNIEPESLEMAFGSSAKPIFWLIQQNATFNDYHQYFTKPIIELAKLDAPEFYSRIKETTKDGSLCCFKEMENLASPFITNTYNLGGKLLLSATIFQAQDYISRVHDLDGMLSLARLKLELLPSENIELSIERSKEKQPYNKQPMNYIQEQNLISFDCLNKGSKCKIEL